MKRAEFIEKWLQALESGEYKQARGQLVKRNHEDRFCCLGVACDVATKNGVLNLDFDYMYGLPEEMQRKIGIDEMGSFIHGVRYNGVKYLSLAHMNDRGVKFSNIARIIREQMEKKNFEKP